MEKSSFNARYLLFGLLLAAVLAVYTLRLADWQLVKGASFLEKAQRTSTAQVTMDAARGEILDVNGVSLAVNKTGYAIQFERAYMPNGSADKTIAQLVSLLNQRGEKWTDILPITLDKNGKPQFIAGQEKEIATLKSRDYLNMADYATAQECMDALVEKYDIRNYSPKETREIASVRYNMTKSGFGLSAPYTFAPDVSKDTVGIVSENSQLLPGATVKVTTVRQYPQGSLLPHILGNVGALDADEYKANKDKGYALNDVIGKSGVEQALEGTLRGTDGEKVIETTNTGALSQETITQAPVSGKSVYLTIDSNLQKVINASLAKNVQATQAYGRELSAQNFKGSSKFHGEDCVAGAAVVLRVKDFAVLAASTYPGYDMNEYLANSDYRVSLNKDNSTKPLINRAFNGIFTPGSSFKPSVALAALQENAITDYTKIFCDGHFSRFASSGLVIACMGHHGSISLNTALAKSCNVFFCETAYRTGIDTMNLYAKRLGLGVKTGIELNESTGILAGPAERTASGGIWNPGDTSQAGIGQSDNQFTPLQLATYTATIANNGVRLQSHIVDKITDYARDKVITQNGATQVNDIGVSSQNLKYVQQGMRSVATNGTAASVFGSYGIAVAGKTGTAQTNNASDNVVFVGYAPYDNPQIAIAVVLEHGATSKFSNAVAKDIFDAYFYHTTVDANGNIVSSTASSQAQSGSSSGTDSAASGAASSDTTGR